MNEQTEQLIRELAEKLGTTTEHLWGVLVRQAPLNAAIYFVISALMMCMFWAFYRLVKRKTAVPPVSESERRPSPEWENELMIIGWLLLGIYGAITAAVVLRTIYVVLTVTMNPEYWALKQLIPCP